jgi:predicted transcriptional regulator
MTKSIINGLQFGTVLKMFRDISEQGNIQNYSHKWNMTYVTVRKNIYDFGKMGLLTIEKSGRQNLVKLTDRGKKLSILFKQIDIIINEEDNVCSEEAKK